MKEPLPVRRWAGSLSGDAGVSHPPGDRRQIIPARRSRVRERGAVRFLNMALKKRFQTVTLATS